jgi:hypothetical protein
MCLINSGLGINYNLIRKKWYSNIPIVSYNIGKDKFTILPYIFRYHSNIQPIKNKYIIIKINNENYIIKPQKLIKNKIKGLIITNNNTSIIMKFLSYKKQLYL